MEISPLTPSVRSVEMTGGGFMKAAYWDFLNSPPGPLSFLSVQIEGESLKFNLLTIFAL